ITLIFIFSSRRLHTISKRDWSSDVCSSDLTIVLADVVEATEDEAAAAQASNIAGANDADTAQFAAAQDEAKDEAQDEKSPVINQIGRASCRERVTYNELVDADKHNTNVSRI